MRTRKDFLAAAASAGALLAARPAAAATPAKAGRKSGEIARLFAQQMRAFDPRLSDAQVAAIAKGIDENLRLGKAINPHGTALKNSDEPATIFEVGS